MRVATDYKSDSIPDMNDMKNIVVKNYINGRENVSTIHHFGDAKDKLQEMYQSPQTMADDKNENIIVSSHVTLSDQMSKGIAD